MNRNIIYTVIFGLSLGIALAAGSPVVTLLAIVGLGLTSYKMYEECKAAQ